MRRLRATFARATSLAPSCVVRAAAALVLAGIFSPALPAGETWDGGGSNDNWTNGANWNALGPFMIQIPPPNNGTANIVMPAVTGLVQTPIVDVPYSINSLTFNSDGGSGRFVILAAAELTIGGGGITNNDADIQSIIGPVALSANQTWNAASGRLQVEAVDLNGFNLTSNGTRQIDLIGPVQGTGYVLVDPGYTSTVTMSGGASNTYTGGTAVFGGTLVLQKSGGAIAIPGNLAIDDAFSDHSGTVRLAANEQITEAVGSHVTVQNGGLLDVNTRTETLAQLYVFGAVSVAVGGKLTATYADVQDTGTWSNSGDVYIGDTSYSRLRILSGGHVTSTTSYIGDDVGVSGEVIIDGANSSWANSGYFHVGNRGHGTLDITAGGDVTNLTAVLGNYAMSTGHVTVDGLGSTWASSVYLIAGNSGDGTLHIANKGQVNAGYGILANNSDGTGTATVDGLDSKWLITSGLEVGARGNATLEITNGGLVSNAVGIIAMVAGSTGSVTVMGAGSTWTNTGNLYVGDEGAGSLEISAGGSVTGAIGYIAAVAESTGSVSVDGMGSSWTVANDLNVGYEGEGSLAVTGGGQASSFYGYLGRTVGGTGEATIDGAGSTWTTVNSLYVGYDGEGTFTITGGGTVSNSSAEIGNTPGSAGAATVDGAGSLWTITNGFDIGDGGDGLLSVTNGGEVRSATGVIADSSTSTGSVMVTGAGSVWTMANGDLRVGEDGNGTLNVASAGRVFNRSGFIGFGPGSTGAATVDGANSQWTNSADLTINIGTLTVVNDGTVSAMNIVIGTPGSIHGDGNIVGVVQNSGLVSPGASPGALHIDGDYTQMAVGQLLIELAPDGYDQLFVSDTATLAGTLAVNLIDGFAPSVGQSFTILTADDVDATFDAELLPSVPNLEFDVVYNAQSVVVTVLSALPGDYSGDGTVDAADYVVWRKTDGSQAGYDAWRANFGATAGAAAADSDHAAVPEPTPLVILLLTSSICVPGYRHWSGVRFRKPSI
jgi:T5SS/PEP-CTERM-associated repeat protein